MTGDDILDAMAHIDPDLIEEADGTPTQRRIRIHRYVLIAAIVALLICLSLGAVATAKGEVNPFFQWGQLLKDFLNKENDPDANPPSVYAKYGDIIITADAIEYKRQLKNLLSNDAAEKHETFSHQRGNRSNGQRCNKGLFASPRQRDNGSVFRGCRHHL